MSRKPNFAPNFVPFDPNLGPQFFAGFTSISSYTLFQAIILCNLKETNEPGLRKWQKELILGLILVCFWPKFGTKNYFSRVLLQLDAIHRCKLSLYAV